MSFTIVFKLKHATSILGFMNKMLFPYSTNIALRYHMGIMNNIIWFIRSSSNKCKCTYNR